jgi:hypothetical protein
MLLAVLFAGTGLLTYQLYSWIAKHGRDEFQLALQLLTGIPFGAACSLRFMTERKWAPAGVVLDCIVWVAAYRLGLGLAGVNPFFSTALAGLIGGIGVTASTGLGLRSIYSRRNLAVAGLVGAIAGLPFGLILDRSAQEDLILAIAFPLWQVAVGICIGRLAVDRP